MIPAPLRRAESSLDYTVCFFPIASSNEIFTGYWVKWCKKYLVYELYLNGHAGYNDKLGANVIAKFAIKVLKVSVLCLCRNYWASALYQQAIIQGRFLQESKIIWTSAAPASGRNSGAAPPDTYLCHSWATFSNLLNSENVLLNDASLYQHWRVTSHRYTYQAKPTHIFH